MAAAARYGRIGAVTRTGTSLARLGLTEPWAEATLVELGWWDKTKNYPPMTYPK